MNDIDKKKLEEARKQAIFNANYAKQLLALIESKASNK